MALHEPCRTLAKGVWHIAKGEREPRRRLYRAAKGMKPKRGWHIAMTLKAQNSHGNLHGLCVAKIVQTKRNTK